MRRYVLASCILFVALVFVQPPAATGLKLDRSTGTEAQVSSPPPAGGTWLDRLFDILKTFVERLLAALGFGPLPPAPTNTSLTVHSDPGDYIGGGVDQTWTPADGTFTAAHSPGLTTISFNGGPTNWTLDFAAPSGAELTAGPYEGAIRFPFQSPSTPGLSVSGSGRGCNTLTGRFDVLEAVYAPDGTVERFAADFEHHCEGGAPALRGSVRFNASGCCVAAAPGADVVSERPGLVGGAGRPNRRQSETTSTRRRPRR